MAFGTLLTHGPSTKGQGSCRLAEESVKHRKPDHVDTDSVGDGTAARPCKRGRPHRQTAAMALPHKHNKRKGVRISSNKHVGQSRTNHIGLSIAKDSAASTKASRKSTVASIDETAARLGKVVKQPVRRMSGLPDMSSGHPANITDMTVQAMAELGDAISEA
ncbi:uncharacterized protein K452DRAFT_313228 [Aplosporella prunicola CBS 121167]|uniref:Uncharacterized protein n=1 Tax=Aplosporella prunicola CBS 121167 TaxID=1176127 RepID=A0A6A6B0V7_9PEZI|nr:uncharacterized protein K452DRAFT_313228 [Aplosporella prunicola CBS 121167]KAF2136361.1 hypothetical protein K452DRAFT_313228 [Aplosporella prunicola CBS 121167]